MTMIAEKKQFGSLVGVSAAMKNVFTMIEKAALVDIPVLIIGETGTGKELVAREIHKRSHRKEGPFVAVNTGAITRELIGSELFGHIRGAFTGASRDRQGRFAEAAGGVVFLDEITTMDMNAQVSLLRALETRQFSPIGSKRNFNIDVRLISATNVSAEDATRRGMLRKDLLYRLQVLSIEIPPLRERSNDILPIAEHFFHFFTETLDGHAGSLSDETREIITAYPWPGNVRELKNVMAHCVIMAGKGEVQPQHLPGRILDLAGKALKKNVISDSDAYRKKWQGSNDVPIDAENVTKEPEAKARAESENPASGVHLPYDLTLEEIEKIYINETLSRCGGNKTQTARQLGISRKALYNRLEKYGLG